MSKPRILVVEDEAIVALDIKGQLKHMGYEVTATVASSEMAIESVRTNPPDLILMDIQIQGELDGIETADRISEFSDLPIVFLTANSDEATLQRAKATRPFGYLLKPFEERELHSTVQMVLYRYQFDRKIRDSEAWLRTTLRSIKDAVVATDIDDVVKYINPQAAELTGWTEKHAIGRPADEVLKLRSRELGEATDDASLTALRGDVSAKTRAPVDLLTKEGVRVPIEMSVAQIIGDSDSALGWVIVFRDVSERLAAEERLHQYQNHLEELVERRTMDLQSACDNLQREVEERKAVQSRLDKAEKMQAVGLLAGGVAHDLNNILAPVVAYPGMILERLDHNSDTAVMVRQVQQAALTAAQVIQDLLTLARRGHYELVPVDLNQVVREFLQSAVFERLTSERPEIEVEVDLCQDAVVMKGSSVHIFKVVMNLVTNAVEAMESQGKLTIRTSRRSLSALKSGHDKIQPGDYVVMSVSDTGIGIVPADIPKLFEPYYSKKELGRSGTGLGLAVVYGILKDHNGYYDVFSEPGEETVFTVYFPESNEAIKETRDEGTRPHGAGRILVVDDNTAMRRLAVDLLQTLGYTAESVKCGEDAIEFIGSNDVDAVVLDMNLGSGIDGLDTYFELERIRPGIKAVVISGYAHSDRLAQLQSVAAAPFVRKPFTLQQLNDAMNKVLTPLPTPQM